MLNRRGITGGQTGPRVLIRAASVADHRSEIAPAALLMEGDRILDVGAPQTVGEVSDARIIDAQSDVLLPGLVNAHAHLDLSGPGPVAYCGDFEQWLESVLDIRWSSDEQDIRAAVKKGAELSLAGGTVLIGDISGMPHVPQFETLRDTPLGGVSYQEFFGLGDFQGDSIKSMEDTLARMGGKHGKLVCGLTPHAPYTCGAELIQAAVRFGVPVAIHVSESLEEQEFMASGTGAFRKLSELLKAWNDGVVIPGCHAVDFTVDQVRHRSAGLPASSIQMIHLNYMEPRHVDILAKAGVSPVYCPRASAYFGHPVSGSHPYRAMLDHDIAVSLGTDSLICLDTPDRISILDEMRFLFGRDATAPHTLLKMATVNGAHSLGFEDDRLFEFTAGNRVAGLLAVGVDEGTPGLLNVLKSTTAPRWILRPVSWDPGGRRDESVNDEERLWCQPVDVP